MEILKTSEEWDNETDIVVMDPDGWDRTNWQFSWFEEKITKEEFDLRVLHSTTIRKIKK